MLIFKSSKFIKSPFNNESELEQVVFSNYEYLFGPNSFYLPKAKIKTADGVGTIPDGFAIDIGLNKWYLVEAELMHHSVWNHIAPQVTKQILASQQSATKRIIVDLAVQAYQSDPYTKEKFDDLGIAAVNVRQILGDILESDPIVGIPIDGVTNDLKDWARTLKYNVKLWIVNKFIELNNPNNIVFEFPEEFRPELDTGEESQPPEGHLSLVEFDVKISDLLRTSLLSTSEKLFMTYKPRNGQQKIYEAKILEDGSLETLGQQFDSPSWAALAGIQNAGSDRVTVNGWTSWKNKEGITLAELRRSYLEVFEKEENCKDDKIHQ
jgi:Restriction Enzyme Adenine Methylase Associated